jgi:polynucleotide 5'-hydroxyl-kinase GRC3/NOL9
MNTLLTSPRSSNRPRSVAFIDLDQNKQEFSPPGQISLVLIKQPLLEPNFARSARGEDGNRIIRAHAIGLNGHKEDMAHYLEAVRDLLQHYQSLADEGPHDLPLVVNCPAWYQGSGTDLTISLTEILDTSHVLCFAQGPAKVLQGIQNAAGSMQIETLPPQPFLNTRSIRTAADMHEMQMLSYYHSESDGRGRANWDATPLAHRRPFHASYGEKSCEFAGIFIFGEVPVMYPSMLSTLLNGSIVSLIAVEDASALRDREVLRGEGDNIPYFTAGSKGYTMPFDPQKSRVIGLALIRGIDAMTQTMQIITPVPGKQVAEVPWDQLVLAFGALECPGWAYLEEIYYQEWAKGNDGETIGSDVAAPWVEELGEDEDGRRQALGLGMQVWKTRRFQ